jgi:hypothetical protein
MRAICPESLAISGWCSPPQAVNPAVASITSRHGAHRFVTLIGVLPGFRFGHALAH